MKSAAKRPPQATVQAGTDRLPTYLTSFVGRDGDIDGLKSLLARSRLVTLTGPGGSGKSRLATEVGRACSPFWPDGQWWVELAPVRDSSQMPAAVVASSELPGRGSALDVLAAWLEPRRTLLVLDNCEHLVAACAEFCQAILERCPRLTVMTTSREPLGVAGETRWPVSSLPPQHARELFEVRAQSVLPDFAVVPANLKTVDQICERLDRMPLAIELAAARIGIMPEPEILNQLKDRFRLLTGGSRTAPERLQTMSAAIDWSYQLLTDDEARLFRRLSVFRGGFTLESAEAVCGEGLRASLLDLVSSLVQKSMVVAERGQATAARYRLLESQLVYAEDRLRASDDFDESHDRHYQYFGRRLDAEGTAWGGGTEKWIAADAANLWAALEWARGHADDLGLMFAAHLARVPFGDLAQVRSVIEDLLRQSPSKGLARVLALSSASFLAYKEGDYEATIAFARECLALTRQLGNRDGAAQALHWMANGFEGRGELDRATEAFREALSLVEASSNYRLASHIRNGMADLAVEIGDYAAAQELLTQSLSYARKEPDLHRLGVSLESLAWAQRGLGEHRASETSWKEALSTVRGITNHLLIVDCLEGLSCAAEALSNDRRAIRLAAAAKRFANEISYRVDPWWRTQYDDSHGRARGRLGWAAGDEAWNEGWAMSWDESVEYALGEGDPEKLAPEGPLSRRELNVAQLVAQGMTNREIADKLFIAERTAEGHVEHIRNKLGFHSRSQIASWVARQKSSQRSGSTA